MELEIGLKEALMQHAATGKREGYANTQTRSGSSCFQNQITKKCNSVKHMIGLDSANKMKRVSRDYRRTNLLFALPIGVRRGVSKGIEHGRMLPTLRVARLQGVDG
jgi:hypothetical protein